MRIISKFKDYYDSVSIYGIDKTLIYNRITKEIEIKSLFYEKEHSKTFDSLLNFLYSLRGRRTAGVRGFDFSFFLVGFCGKLHVGIKIIISNGKFLIIYSLDEAFEILNIPSKKDKQTIYSSVTKEKLIEAFKSLESLNSNNFFINLNSPIFFMDKECIIKNPNLKELEFFKVFDSFTTFGNISQYLGNVLVNKDEKENIEMTEKDKLKSKGFDKYSFKKEKGLN